MEITVFHGLVMDNITDIVNLLVKVEKYYGKAFIKMVFLIRIGKLVTDIKKMLSPKILMSQNILSKSE